MMRMKRGSQIKVIKENNKNNEDVKPIHIHILCKLYTSEYLAMFTFQNRLRGEA